MSGLPYFLRKHKHSALDFRYNTTNPPLCEADRTSLMKQLNQNGIHALDHKPVIPQCSLPDMR
jgi:hypothetical protein